MKLVRKLGRRGFLGMTGLLALGRSAVPGQTAEPPSHDAVRVLAGGPASEPGPIAARVMDAVRNALTAELSQREDTTLVECIGHRLDCLFPDRVALRALEQAYVWVWVEDHWERVCFDPFEFQVRLAPELAVVIEVDQTTRMG